MINIKLKSSSDTFVNWIKEVDDILSTTQITTIDGQAMEYSEDHFQEQMRRLQQCSMNFDMHPIYPINEQVAMDLIHCHIKGKQDNDDKSIF